MANSSAPLVSIITSYYNDQEFLADAILSVLAQTCTNFEYILVNHASTDNSRQIAHSFHDARIKHIDLPRNYGASGNILIKKAMWKYILRRRILNKILSFYSTPRGYNIKLFGCIKTKIWPKKQAK